ncbi:alpha-N-acetylglucosaminidase TIM-barrel domain-containing protein [Streptomyces tendae]|uniref:alpha-N-acetylglucosaminidase TIM-barrel domain-containing protein n=1 Tax=Streptomyces tendae TaxID=1932 RepID=UPI00368D2DB2
MSHCQVDPRPRAGTDADRFRCGKVDDGGQVDEHPAVHGEDATWVMHAWSGKPRQGLLDAIDTDRVIVLDITGEHHREDGFGPAPWAWGILPNYGGRTNLYGDLEAVAALPRLWRGESQLP